CCHAGALRGICVLRSHLSSAGRVRENVSPGCEPSGTAQLQVKSTWSHCPTVVDVVLIEVIAPAMTEAWAEATENAPRTATAIAKAMKSLPPRATAVLR